MRVIKHGQSPLQALYDVLVAPSMRQSMTSSISRAQHSANPSRIAPQRPFTQIHTSRTTPVHNSRAFSTSSSLAAKTRPPEVRTQLWNDEIPAWRIRILDAETNTLSPPRPLRDTLRLLDDKTHRLVCVTPLPTPEHEDGRHDARSWLPTCKIVSKKDEYEREKARRELKKKTASSTGVKTLELNWAIDRNNDLLHRLKRIKEFLEEGRRVEVVLAKKKRGREATPEECAELLKSIRGVVEEVKGAKEMKSMEGEIGGIVTIFLEGAKA